MTGDRNREQDRRRREEQFVQGVLGRTSGSACDRAAGMLPALADGELADLDRQLLTAHLEHCAGCRSLAVTLGWLEPLLPRMAEIDPGPLFLQAVLDRTSRAAPGLAAGPILEPGGFGPARWMDRLGRWWSEQILRPLFPVQVAYVATVVIVLLTATPISPWRSAPRQALESMQAQVGTLELFGPTLGAASGDAERWLADRTDALLGGLSSGLGGLGDDWNRRASRSAPARTDLARELDRILDLLGDRDVAGAISKWPAVSDDLRASWKSWWGSASDLPPTESNQPILDGNDRERSTP